MVWVAPRSNNSSNTYDSKQNRTCHNDFEDEKIVETELWHHLTFHDLALIITASFCIMAMAVSLFLILRHATHYLKPYEQKHIIRIVAMIPIYTAISFISLAHYRKAVYFEIIRDCYEAFALASFFTLLCHYVAPNLHEQKEYFRTIKPKNWVWPLNWLQKCDGSENKGWLRKPRSGLTWFNIMWIGIFQYCLIRSAFSMIAIITQSVGEYCEHSHDVRYAYSWVAGFEAASAMTAMYCVVQFYKQLQEDLDSHRPFLKICCFKLSVFLCFWQRLIISSLTAKGGPLKGSAKFASADIRIGVPSMLACVEMTIFAIVYLEAFPWKPYDLDHNESCLEGNAHVQMTYKHGPVYAIRSAMNPWDILKACGRGLRWLFVGVHYRRNDPSYEHRLGEGTLKNLLEMSASTERKKKGDRISGFVYPDIKAMMNEVC